MKKRILLVDDEEDIRTLYKKTIEKGGYLVETASNGMEALEMVETFNPNLVILDIMMPDMDGWEVTKKIRKKHSINELPIIILSVKSEIADKVKSTSDLGANRHCTKPVDGNDLIYMIKTLLDEL